MKALLIAKAEKPSMLPKRLGAMMNGRPSMAANDAPPADDNDTGVAVDEPETGMDEGKIDPSKAFYVDTAPACETCSNFESPNLCSLVAGPVAAGGWCRLHSEGEGDELDMPDVGNSRFAGSAGGLGSLAGAASDEYSG